MNGIRMLRALKRVWGTSMMVIGVWNFLISRRSLCIGSILDRSGQSLIKIGGKRGGKSIPL